MSSNRKLSGENFDKFKPNHFQAVAEREALRGEPANVRTIQLMMLTADITTNEQDYTILFRSYWKNGKAADLVAVLQEMDMFGLKPTQSMIEITTKACQAAKDTAGEQAIKSLGKNPVPKIPESAPFKTRLETEARGRLQRMELTRQILSQDGPSGDYFFTLFDSHKSLV